MNRYIVTYDLDGEIVTLIETATEIFRRMEMDDCYDIDILSIQWIKPWKNATEFRLNVSFPSCEFSGTWCCKNPETGKIDPLRMEIREKFGESQLLDVAYAEDH